MNSFPEHHYKRPKSFYVRTKGCLVHATTMAQTLGGEVAGLL